MAFRYLNRPRGGSTRAFDTDVLAWEAAVVANGGSVSLARRIILDQFVFSEKASGAWALTDDYWGLWGANAPQALTSLKQRRLAVAVNSPTFTADRGYAFDGVTNYLDLGFVASTHAIAMTPSSSRIGVYERTDVTANTFAIGAANGSTISLSIRPKTNSPGNVSINASSSSCSLSTLAAAGSQGFTVGTRRGAAAGDVTAFKNGIIGTVTTPPGAVAASLPPYSMYVGCYNAIGVATGFRANSVGFAATGASLSDAQELAQYNAVQRWATDIGANV